MTEFYQGFVTVAGAVSAIVLNALWQDALLVLCVWLLLRVWPRVNASTRYTVWSATLAAALIVPVVTTLVFFAAPQTAHISQPPTSHTSGVAPAHESLKTRSATRTNVPRAQTPVRVPREAAPLLPERLHVTLPLPLTLGIFALWLVLATYALARLIVGLVRLEQLKRDGLPLPIEYRDSMPQWLSANKGGRDVRLCVSDETDVPVAVGLFDAMILIPRTLLDHLSEPEVDQICLHELAHLRRADDWSNGAQRVIEALLGWNPAAQFIGQQLDLEREVACDDWVLSFVGKVRPYALCLTKMAETASWPRHPIPAPGVFATRKHISLRIERLLGAGRNIATTLALGPAAVAVTVVAAIALLIGVVAPTVAAPVVAVPPVAPVTAVRTVPAAHAVPPAPAKHPVETKVPQPRVAVPATPAAAAVKSTLEVHRVAQSDAAKAKASQADALSRKLNSDAQFGARIAEQVSAPAIDNALKRVSSLLPTTIAQSSSGKNCSGCDFRNVNWQGRDLRGVSYTGVDLSNANLNGANLAGSTLNGVDFSNANLHGVSFRNAHLIGCDFHNANLTGTDFTGATITGCQFRNAALGSAQMRDVLNHCKGCDFSGASMSGLDLRGVRANGDDFGGADLRNVNFSGSELVGIDFGNAKMDGVKP